MAQVPNFSVENDRESLNNVNCESLQVSGDLTVGGAIRPGTFTNRVVSLDANAAEVLTAAQSGTTFVLNRAAGVAVTLPTAAVGLNYTFVVGTTAVGSYVVAGATTGENYQGSLVVIPGSAHLMNPAGLSSRGIFDAPAVAGTDNTLTLTPTLQGGRAGGAFKVSCIRDRNVGTNTVNWQIEGTVFKQAGGTAQTCFS